jgi:DNA-binding transcriptional MerR regulator
VADRAGRGGEWGQRRPAVRAPVDGPGAGRGGPPPRGSAAKPLPAPDPYRYTMADLERETGLNARTIRYYIAQGLLPPAHGRGPSATYDLGHLLRLQAIQFKKASHLPLDEIKRQLGDLTDEDIAAMLEVETAPPEDRWRRIQLHSDIELHVRERGGRGRDLALQRVVDRIVRLARFEIDDLERGS